MILTWKNERPQPIPPNLIAEIFFTLRDRYQRQDSAPLSMVLRFKNLLELNAFSVDKVDILGITLEALEDTIAKHPCFSAEEGQDTSRLIFCDIDTLKRQTAPFDTKEGARIRNAAIMAFGTLLNEEGGPLWI